MARAVEELPRLVAAVAAGSPDRAVTLAGVEVALQCPRRRARALGEAMGGVLGPDALVPIVLTTVVPQSPSPKRRTRCPTRSRRCISMRPQSWAIPSRRSARTRTLSWNRSTSRSVVHRKPLRWSSKAPRSPTRTSMRGSTARPAISFRSGSARSRWWAWASDVRSSCSSRSMPSSRPAEGTFRSIRIIRPNACSRVVDTAGARIVLGVSGEHLQVPAHTRVVDLDRLDLTGFDDRPITDSDRTTRLRSADLAYVIFTSGSTGLPKGVAVPHSAVAANTRWRIRALKFSARDVVLLKTPVTFDVSVWELFVPLQVGGRLVIARPDGHQDPEYLAQTMIDHAVTAAHFVPSMLAVYVAEPLAARVESLRCVLASGEELPANTAARFHERSRAELHNLYGPTERRSTSATIEPTPATRRFRSASPCRATTCSSWTKVCVLSPSAWPANCISRVSNSRVATSRDRISPATGSLPIRTAPPVPECIGPGTWCAGVPTTCSSTLVGSTFRSSCVDSE